MGTLYRLAEVVERHFAWKVRERKRSDRNPLLVTFQDKYAAKLYAAARGVGSAKLLWVTNDPTTLPFDHLPSNFFIKATHGQSWNIRCTESGLYHDRSQADAGRQSPILTREACIALCLSWLGRSYSASEWAYSQIEPRLIVERSLTPRTGTQLFDYRFYTFGGKVRAISLGSPHYRRHGLNIFLTPDWQVITLSRYAEALPPHLPKKPETLGAMIAAAERLAQDSDFVRVDLYDSAEGIMLGELTVYPQGGRVGTPSGCPVFNRWLGAQWVLSPQPRTFADNGRAQTSRKAGASNA